MKKKIKVAGVYLFLTVGAFGLTACASPAPSQEDNDSSYVEDTEAYDSEKAYLYSDENSVIKVGDNGVTTITVTLNNGTKIECVEYTTLVCFPELSSPR
jgi:hypothetical protein